MDWFVYGGRETGNLYTLQPLFNKTIPRPLNKYVGYKLEVFHCPCDTEITPWNCTNATQFESVGNSYNFNANGFPGHPKGGFAGVRYTKMSQSSRRVVFFDAAMLNQFEWHDKKKGNICLGDGAVVFADFPGESGGEYLW